MQKSHSNLTPKIVGTVIISSTMLIGIYTLVIKPNQNDDSTSAVSTTETTTASAVQPTTTTTGTSTTTQQTTSNASSSSTAQSTTSTTATSSYKDGTYKASVSYSVPHGETNTIDVEITIKNGVVSSVNTDNDYADHESGSYISSFEGSISSKVVGKALSELSLSRVGGASLTTSAFKKAITTISTQAKA